MSPAWVFGFFFFRLPEHCIPTFVMFCHLLLSGTDEVIPISPTG